MTKIATCHLCGRYAIRLRNDQQAKCSACRKTRDTRVSSPHREKIKRDVAEFVDALLAKKAKKRANRHRWLARRKELSQSQVNRAIRAGEA